MDVGHIQQIVKSKIGDKEKPRMDFFFSNRFYNCNAGVGVEAW
jgi:hypothetical protein